jgi:hypothetical protein
VILVFTSLGLGGVVWTRLVLRSEPYAKPSPAAVPSLRLVVSQDRTIESWPRRGRGNPARVPLE